MLSYHLTVGLVPIRRDVTPRPGIFNWEKAELRGRAIVDYIEKNFTDSLTTFLDLSDLNSEALLITEADAEKVADRFRAAGCDAIVLINCNFGNEEAAGLLAHALSLPTLLWAPLDDEFTPEGMRYTDSQCGIFGMSRMLQRMNTPFTFLETCRVDSEIFREGFLSFLGTACMVKNFRGRHDRGLRVIQVGSRPKPFCSVVVNEGELMQRFNTHIIPVNMGLALKRYDAILADRAAELAPIVDEIRGKFAIDDKTAPKLEKIAAFVLLYEELLKEYDADVISSECWTSFLPTREAVPCTAFSILADRGIIIACESDIHGAITMALMSCAVRGKKRPFFGEFTVRHPEDRNVELLWHCGPFAHSLKAADSEASVVDMRAWFRVKDGEYTVARIDQEDGKYSVLNGTCTADRGPKTFGTHLWARFHDLPAWERKLVEGPYIHHCVEIEGDVTQNIAEFCKYVPALRNDRMA